MQLIKTVSVLSLAASALAQGDLGSLLASQPDLSTLLSLVNLAGLNSTLSTASNITILAPTNDAFAKLDTNGAIAQAAANKDVAAVTAVLSNHVLQGYYAANSTSSVPIFVQTLLKPNTSSPSSSFSGITNGSYNGLVKNGNGVNIISGDLTVANVTAADIVLGSKIIIHKIDTVLPLPEPFLEVTADTGYTDINAAIVAAKVDLPLGAPGSSSSNLTDFTIFIPNNAAFESIASVLSSINQTVVQEVLAYHVIAGNVIFSPSLGNVTVPSAQGSNLTLTVDSAGGAWVNNAKIIVPNIIFYNGVAHVIDDVLNPLVPFNRTLLTPSAPAASRMAFSGAASSSVLPFSSIAYASLATSTKSIAAILTTAPAVATVAATASTSATGATTTSSRAAAPRCGLSGAMATGAAVMLAGGLFAMNL
ncbi:hypothetical protein AMS68_000054 [Peltaster fructicola]|uniref:FAS1 domain-containing protein n=1 Tax=Peltaster fructicola TaxID=286661 RepID=A0A6H0XIJ1_9PEZI|nr:hypothetical protein AMS68_000054 [Peltaster fructicola]